MSNSVVVECNDLRVVRGGAVVLPAFSCQVREGTVTGLLGPSGCGKSTLLRSVVGTQIVAGGRISVLGLPAGDRALRTQVGYAAQSASVYLDLTVAENIRYFATSVSAPADDVDRVLDAVDLAQYADRVVGRLSGGQRNRVSLAVSLLGTPRLLVLDEPTVGLDPVLREQLWTLFHDLAEHGVTLLVSSHVMDEAERCDELMLMRDGALVAQAAPDDLRTRTGADSMDAAFLSLIRERDAA
ncbi:MAG TPA: ABC transporter ATP-binding protein [Jatrophihabitantaceae bacterium]|nr:ABC transporter ATP-binding protein [Jatrophihabitantaceae bacterium]